MKHLKLFESMTEIEVDKICKKHRINNFHGKYSNYVKNKIQYCGTV